MMPLEPVAPPRVIGARYALLAELGRGGMGVVWRAEDRVIGRQVAVKELRLPDGVPEREREVFRARVLREVRTAGRLSDPAVVTVFDVVADGGATYIVMELVAAPTLAQLVHAEGPRPAADVAALAGHLLDALAVAHAAGIVHRDVKPSNIMVLPGGRTKLADFGIAQAADDPKLTNSGILVGSPAYIAPERVRGGEAIPASDLWAVGAVLWYAAEGRAPFERPTTAATLHAIVGDPPPLTRCDGPLASVIMGLLIPDPATRLTGPQAAALLRVPRAAVEPTTRVTLGRRRGDTVAYPDSGPARRERRGRGGRLASAVLAALVLACGALAGGYAWGAAAHAPAPTGIPPVPAMAATLTYGPGGDLPGFELGAGQCGNGRVVAGVNRIGSGDSADCSGPHDFEVYLAADALTANVPVDYPEPARLARHAEDVCTLAFQSALITAPDKDTRLRYEALVPTAGQWRADPSAPTGSRTMYCVVWAPGAQLDQSVVASPS